MKLSIRLLAVLIMGCVMCGAALAADNGKGTPVATVNGVVLTQAELDQEVNGILNSMQTYHGRLSDEKAREVHEEALKNLVEMELRYQDARAKGMGLGEAALAKEVDTLASRFKSRTEFQAAIAATGFDDTSFSRYVERMAIVPRVYQAEVTSKLAVTDELVRKHYADNSRRYMKPREDRIGHILIKVGPTAGEEEKTIARQRADAVIARLRAGIPFADLASKASDTVEGQTGADVGFHHSGQLLPELEQAVEKLKVGESSGVVDTIYGHHILMLLERRPPRQIPFDDVRGKIRESLVESETKRLLDGWMGPVRARAVITYPGKK